MLSFAFELSNAPGKASKCSVQSRNCTADVTAALPVHLRSKLSDSAWEGTKIRLQSRVATSSSPRNDSL